MKALVFDQAGAAESVLSLREIPRPVPGPGELVVRMMASPINPSDLFFIRGTYRFKPRFPQTAGLEGAGIIEAAGPGTSLIPGTLVSFDARGAWAEFVTVAEASAVALPAGFSLEKAAQFYLNPFTAWCLLDAARVPAGDWLAVTGAGSAVSRIAIQLAHRRGIRVIAVVRDTTSTEELRSLGADAVLGDSPDLAERLSAVAGEAGLRGALDAVGGKTGTAVVESLSTGGRLIVYGLLSPDETTFHNATLIYKNLTVSGFGVRQALAAQPPAQRTDMIDTLRRLLADPGFQLPVAASFPIAAFRGALGADAAPGRKGKILLQP